MDPAFCVCVFLFFFFDLLVFCFLETNGIVYHCLCIVYVLFMYCLRNPQPLYEKKKKKGSHGTIYTLKNYFAIVFSVFSFQQNKLYPNRPLVSIWIWMKTHVSKFLLFFFFWPTPLALFMRHKQYIKVNVQCLGEWTVTKKLFFCCFQQ